MVVGKVLAHIVADCVKEVSLAKTGVTMDKERVVGTGRRLRYPLGGGVGEAVGCPDYEGVEGVAGVEGLLPAPFVASG
jgi:hypothetical protein